MQHASTLVVLTLLQLCRAEIPEAIPEWYAANLINDVGFQPKPLTEIFTTQASFSSKNPIIVTSTATSVDSEEVFSTSPTIGRGQTTPTTPTDSRPSTEDTTRRVIPLLENRPQTPQTPETSRTLKTPQTIQTPQPLDTPRQMYQAPPQIQVLVAQAPPQIQQQLPPSPPNPQVPQIPPSPQMQLPQLPPMPQTPSPPQVQVQPLNQQQQTTGQPNYFLIYQQAPLSIQQYPQSAAQSVPSIPVTQTTTETERTQRTTQEATSSTTIQTVPSQPSTELSSTELPTTRVSTTRRTTTRMSTTESPTTQTTTQVSHRNTRQGPFGFSSTITPFGTTWLDPSIAPGVPYSNPPISSTILPNFSNVPCSNTSNTGNPTTNVVGPPQPQIGNRVTGLTIRVSAPRGSITNIKINPSTTTKKPSTRRPPRRKSNNYNNCVDSCKGRKEPLCATPLAIVPINPNTLKGFPSICHLACHNSFRNQPYEKVIDGRCSKLRTRIHTFEKNKIKRDELEKSQYTVLNNVPETIVQVIQSDRSGRF